MKTTRDGQVRRPLEHDGVPESLYRNIATAIAAMPSAHARTSTRTVAALAIAGALSVLIVALASALVYGEQAVGLRIGVASTTKIIAASVLTVGLASAATVAALWRGGHGFGAPALSLALTAMLVAPLYALFGWISPVHVTNAALGAVVISPWGTRCVMIASLVGATVLVAFTLALQRAVPVAVGSRAAAIGASAGAWAGLAVFVFCPSGDQAHLFSGHVLPIVGLTAIGALAAPRWLQT
jgi:Negative regulator of sigma F